MYRRFTYPKLLRGFSDCGVGFDDEVSHFYGPLLDVGFQFKALPVNYVHFYLYVTRGKDMIFFAFLGVCVIMVVEKIYGSD